MSLHTSSNNSAPRKNQSKIHKLFFLIAIVVLPSTASAIVFKDLVVFFVAEIVNPAIIVIIGFAVVFFFWGVAKFILHADNAEKREEGRGMMIYGIIALFVMVSMWGIVILLKTTFFGWDSELNTVLPRASDLVR